MIASIKSFLTRPASTALLNKLLKSTFQLLILLLPTQLALHFWPTWAYVYGFRVDYFSPAIYFTDIVVVVLFALWSIQARNKGALHKSIAKRSNSVWIAALLIILFMAINIYSAKGPWIAAYKWVKVVEFILIGVFVSRKKEFDINSWIAKPISYSIIVVSIIAFVQFGLQRTVGGLLYLLGERSFNVITPGIATFTLFGRELLRPYSIFPHPNAMAGFVGVGFFLLLWGANKKLKETLLYKLSLGFSILTLVLSVSHGAWIAVAITGLMLVVEKYNVIIFKRLCVFLVVLTIAVSLFLPTMSDNRMFSFGQTEEVEHRLLLAKVSGSVIANNPIVGVGEGNFILSLVENPDFPKMSWWLQPVHNTYLLIFSETGFIGLCIFVCVLLIGTNDTLFKKDKRLLAAFIFIILTGFFDHYWVTLQQPQILLAVVIGLMFRKNKD